MKEKYIGVKTYKNTKDVIEKYSICNSYIKHNIYQFLKDILYNYFSLK